jgi:hypothetical protein
MTRGNVIEHRRCPSCGMCRACGYECAQDCDCPQCKEKEQQ